MSALVREFIAEHGVRLIEPPCLRDGINLEILYCRFLAALLNNERIVNDSEYFHCFNIYCNTIIIQIMKKFLNC